MATFRNRITEHANDPIAAELRLVWRATLQIDAQLRATGGPGLPIVDLVRRYQRRAAKAAKAKRVAMDAVDMSSVRF